MSLSLKPPVRYWGRKAGESVDLAVGVLGRLFGLRGGVVLDPFAGAGSLARGLLANGFNVVAVDVNFYAWLITRAAVGKVRLPRGLGGLLGRLRLRVRLRGGGRRVVEWWRVLGVRCGGRVEPLRYRVCSRSESSCIEVSTGGCSSRRGLDEDPVLEVLDEYPKVPLRYPDGSPFDKRRTVDRVDQLYSPMMLAAMAGLARLARRWSPLGPVGVPVWLAVAALAYSSSRMQRASGGSWPVNSYWLPDRWLERNPILLLERKVKAIVDYSMGRPVCTRPSGLRGLRWGRFGACVLWGDARRLRSLAPRGFFDAVVTDPPHYDEVQYYELSVLHLSWLTLGLGRADAERALSAYRDEIVVNARRGVGEDEYLGMLREAFESIYYVLKPGAPVVLLLHEEDVVGLERIIGSVEAAGFRFVSRFETRMPTKPIGAVSRNQRRSVLTVAIGRRDYMA